MKIQITLARIYQIEKRYDEAEKIYKRILKDKEYISFDGFLSEDLFNELLHKKKILAKEEKIDITAIKRLLAELYVDKGSYVDALYWYDVVIDEYKASKGPYHPVVAKVIADVAGLYSRMFNYYKAEEKYNESLEILSAKGKENTLLMAEILYKMA